MSNYDIKHAMGRYSPFRMWKIILAKSIGRYCNSTTECMNSWYLSYSTDDSLLNSRGKSNGLKMVIYVIYSTFKINYWIFGATNTGSVFIRGISDFNWMFFGVSIWNNIKIDVKIRKCLKLTEIFINNRTDNSLFLIIDIWLYLWLVFLFFWSLLLNLICLTFFHRIG